jgi:hypothetical protein
LDGQGTWKEFIYPSDAGRTVTGTLIYGVNGDAEHIRLCGSFRYTEGSEKQYACTYEGYPNGTGVWKKLVPPSITDPNVTEFESVAHSTVGELVVGNYWLTVEKAKCFIYNVRKDRYDDLVYPDARTITGYTVLDEGNGFYTIGGGLHMYNKESFAFLVTWDSIGHIASNWRLYAKEGANVSHFEGMSPISPDDDSTYTFSGNWAGPHMTSKPFSASLVIVNDVSSSKSQAQWYDFVIPNSTNTSANSIVYNHMVGVFQRPDNPGIGIGYIANFSITAVSDTDDTTSDSSDDSNHHRIIIIVFAASGTLVLALAGYALLSLRKKKRDQNGRGETDTDDLETGTVAMSVRTNSQKHSSLSTKLVDNEFSSS